MTAVVITAALFFCNITPLKNAAKDSLPCPDNTNKFILFWVKFTSIKLQKITISRYRSAKYFICQFARYLSFSFNYLIESAGPEIFDITPYPREIGDEFLQ